MIISKILGGLGNQMFQYAIGKVIAEKHQTAHKFDLRGLYKGEDVRTTFELDVFGIPELQATKEEYFPFFQKTILKSKKLYNIKYKNYVHYKEPDLDSTYKPELIKTSTPNMYLRGLYQTEKYFKNHRHLILDEFTFQKPLEGKNLELKNKFDNENSVAIHIRRGEFASAKYNNSIGTTSMDYYNKAIKHINDNVDTPAYYIFSDSPEWVKENFELLKDANQIDWNSGKESYRDMQLMSLCKHNIIANSTFSWWGAWLNKNPEKIVIAPEVWFSGWEYDTKDLIPENWIKL